MPKLIKLNILPQSQFTTCKFCKLSDVLLILFAFERHKRERKRWIERRREEKARTQRRKTVGLEKGRKEDGKEKKGIILKK